MYENDVSQRKTIKSLEIERVMYERIWLLDHNAREECVFEILLRTQIQD